MKGRQVTKYVTFVTLYLGTLCLSRGEVMTEKYSLEEQETIISFDKAGKTANIYTFESRWQKHLEKLGVKPAAVSKTHQAKTYEIPKSWLRLPRKPSEARRLAGKNRLIGQKRAIQ